MKVLLTGFEPFGGSQVNPSAQVVGRLARDGVPGVALHSAILPVDRQGGPATLLNAVRALHSDGLATAAVQKSTVRIRQFHDTPKK